MNLHERWTRSLKSDTVAEGLPGAASHPRGKGGNAGPVFWRFLVCFFLMIFTSFYAAADDAKADKVQSTKEEVKQGIKETKEEIKKMPGEMKKAGKEVKKKTEEVKKKVETDIEEGKRNVRSLTK
jgi:Skp family chaperone for outer membrane proteins